MADHDPYGNGSDKATKPAADATDRCGVFDFLKKKDEEKPSQDVAMVDVEEAEKKEQKPTHLKQLHRSDSKSSSSSDEEEEGEGGEKKKKKKKQGLKEKIRKKISGEKEELTDDLKETSIPTGKSDGIANAEAENPEEKKGFLEKIKGKLPGQHKKDKDGAPAEEVADGQYLEGEPKEKKGNLEKIKEKMPGYHKNEEHN